ncbi:hypothetical protein NADE_005781 [Nannochloris sp. 'desiccata']|nr:hypothetical protein NADE_005781 [Chlorella desiccata (nom. nud.)]
MSFGKLRPKREQGLSLFSGYRWSWGGAPWQPLLASASSLLRATSDGTAVDIAGAQTGGPGIYELAIVHKDQPTNYIAVYVGAAANVREALFELMSERSELKGFLDHCLKENCVVWIRVKPRATIEAANAARDRALANLDFAWVQQPGARGRSLTLKPHYQCCGCLCKGKRMILKEGPPKFLTQQKSGFKQMFSGKKR